MMLASSSLAKALDGTEYAVVAGVVLQSHMLTGNQQAPMLLITTGGGGGGGGDLQDVPKLPRLDPWADRQADSRTYLNLS